MTDMLLCQLYCLNGRCEAAREIFIYRLSSKSGVLSELLLTMLETHRVTIKNLLDMIHVGTADGLMIEMILHRLVGVGGTREDIKYFIDKDREFLSNHEDVVKPFLDK